MPDRVLLFGSWEAEADPQWTVLLNKKLKRPSSDICGCIYCKIWQERREKTLCDTCRGHVSKAGLDLTQDWGNSPVLLDRDLVYMVQFRAKGVLAGGRPFECAACKTKVWATQDTMERHIILINLSATIPLDDASRAAIAASQVVKTSGGNR